MTTALDKLLRTMAALRDPHGGCPWDLKQTHHSLIPYLLEETYEVVDALERGDDGSIREELGDLLFQIVFHARIAEEQGRFGFDDVAADIDAKLVRRHPHVFGDSRIDDERELEAAWERSKAAEKAPSNDDRSLLDGVIRALPALMRAQKLQRRAARVGFDWPDHRGPLEKVREEAAEIEAALGENPVDRDKLQEEIGDLLFSVVNLARHLDVDAEQALNRANEKFRQRFRYIETGLANAGRDIESSDPEALERLWEQSKQNER